MDQKKRIEAKPLESEGVQFFLDDVLVLSLRLDMTIIYSKFVDVLKNSDDPVQCEMAMKIGTVCCILLHFRVNVAVSLTYRHINYLNSDIIIC